MSFTSKIEVQNPYDLLFVGLSNYIAKRLDVPIDDRDFQYIEEKEIEAFKYQEVICELAALGFIKYEFSDSFVLKGSTAIRVLKEIECEKFLMRFYNKEDECFYIDEEDLRTDENFNLFRQGSGFDLGLTVFLLTIALLNYRYNMVVPVYFTGDKVSDYFREASTLHYYKVKGYLEYTCNLNDKVLNSLNANIFKSLGYMKGYLRNDLISYYDKLSQLEEDNIVKGSVVYLYKKNQEQLTSMNDIVEDCSLAIVVDYGDFGIKLRKLPIRTSYEYVIATYSNYSDDIKDLYGGLEHFFPYNSPETVLNLTWTSCGVSYVQNSKFTQMEEYFVTDLRTLYNVELPVMLTDDGVLTDVEFQAPEAVLFLLLQYQVDFAKDLFLKEYGVNFEKVESVVKTSMANIEAKLGYKLKK
jgi:hypothetical protein